MRIPSASPKAFRRHSRAPFLDAPALLFDPNAPGSDSGAELVVLGSLRARNKASGCLLFALSLRASAYPDSDVSMLASRAMLWMPRGDSRRLAEPFSRFRHMTKIAMGEPRAASAGKSSPRDPHWRFSSLKSCPRSPARAPRRMQQGDDFASAPITSAPSGPSRPSRAACESSALARAGAPRLPAQGFRASFRASALRQTPSSHIDFGKCNRMLRAYLPRLARKGFRAALPRASRAIFADRFRERFGVVFQTAATAGLSDFDFAISPSAASR